MREYIGSLKILKTVPLLAYHEFTCMISFKTIFFEFSSAVNKVNSKHSQISMSLINFQGKILIFKEVQVPFKKEISNSSTFQGVQGLTRTLKL